MIGDVTSLIAVRTVWLGWVAFGCDTVEGDCWSRPGVIGEVVGGFFFGGGSVGCGKGCCVCVWLGSVVFGGGVGIGVGVGGLAVLIVGCGVVLELPERGHDAGRSHVTELGGIAREEIRDEGRHVFVYALEEDTVDK